MNPILELICTGSELLNGRSVNTHARLIARALAPLNLALRREATLPDDPELIAEAVRAALLRSDVVLVSGGLGPTQDDCTREAVASALSRGIREDADTLARMKARYAAFGRSVNRVSRRQAQVVEGARVLPNPAGVAPGEQVDTERGALFLLPGPPGELAAVLDAYILPWLAERYPEAGAEECILMVAGLGESDIVDRIEKADFPSGRFPIGYCAAPGRVEVRVIGPVGASCETRAQADTLAALLGDAVYARRREELEGTVSRGFVEKNRSLSVAESCTGGLLSARLTDAPGSSRFFKGGCVAYANAAKTALLNVPPDVLDRFGAVSEETAAAMAEGVRARFDSDVGLSITGIAGPDGGTADKPVGLVFIGLADANSTSARSYRFGRDRALNREWSVQRALDRVRRHEAGLSEP